MSKSCRSLSIKVRGRTSQLARRLGRCSGQAKGGLVFAGPTLPKTGAASGGVARQYGGALGKVAHCQAIVTGHDCGPRTHFPLLGAVD